jgi:hypothetical protein
MAKKTVPMRSIPTNPGAPRTSGGKKLSPKSIKVTPKKK